jgi:hypothetical protein
MVFCFVQKKFSDNTKIRIFFFFRAKREFFFQNLTLGYMTKTLNQITFFFLHQNQNIFFSNIGNQNIFLEKIHNPPPLQEEVIITKPKEVVITVYKYVIITVSKNCEYVFLYSIICQHRRFNTSQNHRRFNTSQN